MPSHDLIGSTEASRILGVNISTVTRWAGDGTLPAQGKLPAKNGAYLFLRAVVEAKRNELAGEAAAS